MIKNSPPLILLAFMVVMIHLVSTILGVGFGLRGEFDKGAFFLALATLTGLQSGLYNGRSS